MLNILFIIDRLELGGTQKILFQLCKFLSEKKIGCFVFCLYKTEPIYKKRFDDIKVPLYTGGPWRLLSGLAFLQMFFLIKRKNIDIVQTFLFWSDWTGRITAKIAGVGNIVSSLRCVNVNKQKWKLFFDKLTASLAKKIIINTKSIKEFAIKNEGIKEWQLHLIYNGIDVEKYDSYEFRGELRSKLGLNKDIFLIGSIARLVPQKGQIFLIEALEQIIKERGPTCGIVLVFSGEGKDKKKLIQYVHQKKLTKNIYFLGNVPDARVILNDIDIFVLTSLFEGMPNSVMEAMAAGLPVIASDVDGVRELVIDRVTGFLVPAQQPAKIAEKILYLKENRINAKKMGQEGRTRVFTHFPLSVMLNNYAELYETMSYEQRRRLADKRRSLECPKESYLGHKNIIVESLNRYGFAKQFVCDKVVLDVGCGRGYGTKSLLDHGAKKVVGIDVNSSVIEEAKQIYDSKADLDFICRKKLPWEFADESFDVVIALEVIEHTIDHGMFLGELSRVLRSGGILVISTPNKKLTSADSDEPAIDYHTKEYIFEEFSAFLKERFTYVEIFGQDFSDYDNKFTNRILNKIPAKVKYLLPLELLNVLSVIVRPRLKTADLTISQKNVDSAKNFIAICKKGEKL